ncbi:MAG TPA: hypothetical protein VMF05_06450 [Stellaceae bacterium]|nr:hypothetical protein [Stellaceae bacterium]
MNRFWSAVFVAALALAWVGTAGAQALPTNNPAAAANVHQSRIYSEVLRSNPAFRKRREAIECGPITDPQLHSQCIASFEAYAAPSGPGPQGH